MPVELGINLIMGAFDANADPTPYIPTVRRSRRASPAFLTSIG